MLLHWKKCIRGTDLIMATSTIIMCTIIILLQNQNKEVKITCKQYIERKIFIINVYIYQWKKDYSPNENTNKHSSRNTNIKIFPETEYYSCFTFSSCFCTQWRQSCKAWTMASWIFQIRRCEEWIFFFSDSYNNKKSAKTFFLFFRHQIFSIKIFI